MMRIITGNSLVLVLGITLSFSFNNVFAESAVNSSQPILSSPLKQESGLQKFIESSPNPVIDVLYLNSGKSPVLIKDIHPMPLHPDTRKKLAEEGKLNDLVNRLNKLKSLRMSEGAPIDDNNVKSSSFSTAPAAISAATGLQRALVICADFSENTSKVNISSFNTLYLVPVVL